MRKAILTLAVFLAVIQVCGQQPSAKSETDKLTAAAALFGPVQHDGAVACSDDKSCSATAMPSVNNVIDMAFAQSAAQAPLPANTEILKITKTKEVLQNQPLRPVDAGIPVPPPPQTQKNASRAVNQPVEGNAVQQGQAAAQTSSGAQAQPVSPQEAAPAQTAANKAPVKKFNPNEFRPNVRWEESHSTHFDIYTQKLANNIGSANLAMLFETAYQTLRRFIPWMMSGRVRVFVYQNEKSYLENEPEARSWTRALAYPFRGEIAVYDVPSKTDELKAVFTHELTHIFTQQFFDNSKTPQNQPPLWLDEGLAVLVEDQAYAGSTGGPWNNDYLTRSFVRSRDKQTGMFRSEPMFGRSHRPPTYGNVGRVSGGNFGPRRRHGRPIRLMNFEDFVKESSLDKAEKDQNTQNWYLQAYLMVRFLLNPGGGSSPTNRMQFERFTRLLAQGEQMRDPSSGYLVKDANGKPVYQKYDLPQALGRTYWYNSVPAFEDAFWQWLNK